MRFGKLRAKTLVPGTIGRQKIVWVFCAYGLFFQERRTARTESFQAEYAADVPESFVRTSQVKSFGQAIETLEKQEFGSMTPGGAKTFRTEKFFVPYF